MERYSLEAATEWRDAAREDGRRVVFTNGCFDLIHAGHVELLERARELGDLLIVGLNDDASVARLKGPGRPLVPVEERAEVLMALSSVDRVVVFGEDTPLRIIEALSPEVLVKGGDWPVEEIVGREAVEASGGEVRSMPGSRPGLSTTALLARIRGARAREDRADGRDEGPEARLFREILEEGARLRRSVAAELEGPALRAAVLLREALVAGRRVLFCGNGGSAADAQHLAAELVWRFEREREALPALALTTDMSVLTAISNDRGFEEVFARQVRAHGRRGDVLVALSTSGASRNVVRAVETAAELGLHTVGLLGRDGGRMARMVDVAVTVRHDDTARIQELHMTLGHFFCAAVDRAHGETSGESAAS